MKTAGLTHWLDIFIIVVYFCIVLGVGIWTLFRPRRGNVQSYFLAGRTMPWFAVGASLFSSNIGSEHFVGLAGAGAAAGIALVLFEWFVDSALQYLITIVLKRIPYLGTAVEPIFLILMLGWLFLPVYISAGVYTLPEYIEKRYGGNRIRLYLSCVALVLYVITKLASSMFSGALFIQMALKWDMYAALCVLLVVTGLYTMLGGLTAVMYTDTFQTAVMVIGSAVVMVASLHRSLGVPDGPKHVVWNPNHLKKGVRTCFVKIGGYLNLERLYFDAIPTHRSNNTTCGMPRSDAFHVFQDPVTGDQPWPGLVLQASLGCLWYWCCDQVIVQRSLAARSLSHAKGGSILAGILKILPLFMLIFPGMISRILYTDDVACSDPDICKEVCDNEVGCSNIAYPKLVLELLPIGARGLLMAVMLSAIMSSLTSIFNSASTVFTMDVWRKIRPKAQQRELLMVGRVFVLIMCVIAVLWIPMVKAFQSGRLFNYMVAVEGYIGSPLGVLFLLSIFWKRTTETGAFYGILLGHILGISRLIVELMYPAPPCGETDTRSAFLTVLHYSYFVQLQLIFTAIMIVLISLCTSPRSDEELEGVTWWTKLEPSPNERSIEMEDIDYMVSKQEKRNSLLEDDHEATNTESRQHGVWSAICGVTAKEESNYSFNKEDTRKFLRQHKTHSRNLNICAVLLIVIVAFITGFYA